MAKHTPDHHDAELLLRVYDLRREVVLRESRRLLARDFWPRGWGDVGALLEADHPLTAAYRQVSSYWELVYSFVRHGIVHPELWVENNAEGLYLFVKVEPYLTQLRQAGVTNAFRNAEWLAHECPEGRAAYERVRARVAQLAAARG
jgi:hypothetical protein